MIFETIESEGLAHLSYVIGDEDERTCAVVDPRRDVDIYLELAQRRRVRIETILETHVHADFVSGSRELQERTGATIYGGASDDYGFEIEPVTEGDRLTVGSLRLRVLHTPGHSPEHVCYVVSGGGTGAEHEWGVFTGDTLFAGEVGRPDLGKEGGEGLARRLHRSLESLSELEPGVVVFPAHGEGSPCGGDIGARNRTTIGYEFEHNGDLRLPEDEFVERLLDSLDEPPRYYGHLKKVNARGPDILGAWPVIPLLAPEELEEKAADEEASIIDMREIVAFGGAHVEGSLNIALRDAFPVWVGRLVEPESPILLIGDGGDDVDAAHRHLLRIGYESMVGALAGGFRSWSESGRAFEQGGILGVHELHARLPDEELQLLDVRTDDEWKSGHLPGARHVFLQDLPERLDDLDRNRPTVTYCRSGFRASAAASLLLREGFDDVAAVSGSVMAWVGAGYDLVGAP